MTCTVAIDAMGGDRAPGEIVAGALASTATHDVRVLLVGRAEEITAHLPGGVAPDGVSLLDARELIAMHDEPATAVRTRKDSSIVRCAQAVRDGAADAMVGAGNTGATMAAALLRMGRVKGVSRPAIAVPIPVADHHPQLLIDGGATVDPAPEWLVQFALMGREYARTRLGTDEPSVGLLSNGEEEGKGDELRKRVFELMRKVPGFVGNVEGRDFMRAGSADVVVTDGFTGNVALKTLEGALRAFANHIFRVFDSTPEAREAAKVIMPLLLEASETYDPDTTGGAVLLGINGVCVISHGSSSARAIVSAVGVAADCVATRVPQRMREVIENAG